MQKIAPAWVYNKKIDFLVFVIPNFLAVITAYWSNFNLADFINIYIVVD